MGHFSSWDILLHNQRPFHVFNNACKIANKIFSHDYLKTSIIAENILIKDFLKHHHTSSPWQLQKLHTRKSKNRIINFCQFPGPPGETGRPASTAWPACPTKWPVGLGVCFYCYPGAGFLDVRLSVQGKVQARSLQAKEYQSPEATVWLILEGFAVPIPAPWSPKLRAKEVTQVLWEAGGKLKRKLSEQLSKLCCSVSHQTGQGTRSTLGEMSHSACIHNLCMYTQMCLQAKHRELTASCYCSSSLAEVQMSYFWLHLNQKQKTPTEM